MKLIRKINKSKYEVAGGAIILEKFNYNTKPKDAYKLAASSFAAPIVFGSMAGPTGAAIGAGFGGLIAGSHLYAYSKIIKQRQEAAKLGWKRRK